MLFPREFTGFQRIRENKRARPESAARRIAALGHLPAWTRFKEKKLSMTTIDSTTRALTRHGFRFILISLWLPWASCSLLPAAPPLSPGSTQEDEPAE